MTIILMIIVVVYIIDYGSRKLRDRYIRGDDYLQGDEYTQNKSFFGRLIAKFTRPFSS